MRILLDSHALPGWMHEPAKLRLLAKTAISDPSNLVYASRLESMTLATRDGSLAGYGVAALEV